MKFSSGSLELVAEEYYRCRDSRVTRLHLDHVPVIDEDHKLVDYLDDISRAIGAGYICHGRWIAFDSVRKYRCYPGGCRFRTLQRCPG